MKTDIEIAQQTQLLPIGKIAEKLGIPQEELIPYGNKKAKISETFLQQHKAPKGKLILVTAVNPTPLGEGKTTVTVGLGMGLCRIGKNAVIALREPSLGPVFGIKGGAAGGGYSQVLPMEDINLHFTGDFHAVTAANNLLCAMIDNHIQQGNALSIDCRRILFPRVTDTNDRALRNVVLGLGGKTNGMPREEHFQITVASEVMAILCLAESFADLKKRLGDILVAYTLDGKPVFCRDLGADGAMTALLRDALSPNLVQTVENTPALIHGGPFANIAHGCSSVRATRLALSLADYTVTEAGFGADLGAEKFFDIKCRAAGFTPSAAVLVATVRALKYNGGVLKTELQKENLPALKKGIENLGAHLDNLKKFGIPIVVAINRLAADTPAELEFVRSFCAAAGVPAAVCEAFAKGGQGAEELSEAVVRACEQPSGFAPLYPLELSIQEKVRYIAQEIYGAGGVSFSEQAQKDIAQIEALGAEYARLPVCMAKTQYSFSDDPSKLGKPRGFMLTVRGAKLSAGAGFIVIYTGEIMTMPGLPKRPAAEIIDVSPEGDILNLS